MCDHRLIKNSRNKEDVKRPATKYMAVLFGTAPALKLRRPHSTTATATRMDSTTERTKLAAHNERAASKTAEGQAQPKKYDRDAAKRGGLPCAATFLSR